MANNYIIEVNDTETFGGWNPITGEMIFLPPERKNLAYRMQRPVAMTTVPKIEKYLQTHNLTSKCNITKISA